MFDRDEVDTHLDTMQSELENLRDILRGEGYSIDANTLLGVSSFEKNVIFFLIAQLEILKLFWCSKK